MSTEQQQARHRTLAGPIAGRRTAQVGIGSLAAAAIVVTLAACGQPSGTPSPGGTAGAGGQTSAQSPTQPGSTQGPTSPGPASQGPTSQGPTGEDTSETSAAASPTPEYSSSPDHAGASKPAAGTCSALAAQLSLDQQIGQLFMVASSSSGMTAAEAHQLSSLDVGSVILLGNSTAGRAAISSVTSSIKDRVATHHGVGVLLAADQEGGLVQRLAGPGFDTIPSAEDQASLSDDQLQADAKTWGRQLKDAGIDVNLAPVSDVVPTSIGSANAPIGALHRGYGPKPSVVASKNTAFIRGMEAAGVGTSVKHFPGLGVVRGNTDTDPDVVDDQTTRDSKRLAGFRAGVKAGVDMVMVSSAVYTKIDPDHPATFSTTVQQGMIRHDLGFGGVIISDDLLGQALNATPVSQRALRFIKAGGDLAIVGQSQDARSMVDAVRRAAADDPTLRSAVQDAAGKVLIMKARHGLAHCTG